MYVVRCPKCDQLLRVSTEVHKATLKCRGCGSLFVGSSEHRPDPAPPPEVRAPQPPLDFLTTEAPPPAPRAPAVRQEVHYVYKPKKATGPVLIVTIMLVALAGAIFVLLYLYNQKTQGKPSGQQGKAASQPGPGPTEGGPVAATPQARGLATPRESSVGGGDLSAKQTEGDPNIPVTGVKLLEIAGNGCVVGLVRNNHSYAIESLGLKIRVKGADDKFYLTSPVTLRYLPAGGALHFSADVNLPPGKPKDHSVKVEDVKRLDARTVCLTIDRILEKSLQGGVLLCRGKVTNPTDQTIRNAYVQCDFHDDQSVHLAERRGEILDGKDIPPGKTATFEVKYEPDVPRSGIECEARLVGALGK